MPSGIQAGKAYVVFGADLSGLANALRSLNRMVSTGMADVRASMDRTGAAIAGVGQQMMSHGRAITDTLRAWADRGYTVVDAAAKTARALGVSVSWLSQMSHAATLAGTDMDTLRAAIARMSVSLYEAQHGSGKMRAILSALGLDIKTIATLRPEEQFTAIADAISRVSDQTTRMAAMRAIFGRAGATAGLGSLLAGGRAGISAGMAEAQRLGIGITDADARLAENVMDMYTRISAAVQGVAIAIGRALGPRLIELATYWSNLLTRVSQFLDANPQVVTGIWRVGEALLVSGGAMVALGKSISALSVLVSPGGVLFAVGAAIVYWTGALDTHIARWRDVIGSYEIGGRQIADWLAAIGRVFVDGLLPALGEIGNVLIDAFGRGWDAFVAFGRAALAWVGEQLAGLVRTLANALASHAQRMQAPGAGIISSEAGAQLAGVATALGASANLLHSAALDQREIAQTEKKQAAEGIDRLMRLDNLRTALQNLSGVFSREIVEPIVDAIGEQFDSTPVMTVMPEVAPALAAEYMPTMREIRAPDVTTLGSFYGLQIARYTADNTIPQQQLAEQKVTNRLLSELVDKDYVGVYGE